MKLNLDGVELIAGEEGLNRVVSWTYLCQTRPYADHTSRGNFALIVVDFLRFDFPELIKTLKELFDLGISGLGVSVVEDKEKIPAELIEWANKVQLPLFYVRWEGASFVDIDQSIGKLLAADELKIKKTGDYLYNLLFGYDINARYIEKISAQFGLDFTKSYRVGIIVVDRTYGLNLETDEHNYEYYANCLNHDVEAMECHPVFMKFLNKFVLLFEAKSDKSAEKEIENVLQKIDSLPRFKGLFRSTCILGSATTNPADFSQSYQQAKNLIPKKDYLPRSRNKKVISASVMGLYKFMFNSGNQGEILEYCTEKLRPLEEYDHANGTELVETCWAYYLNGFSIASTADDMFIHRNTLQYRLKKIEELVSFPLDDYVELLDLINCIYVKRMMYV
ncbi:MAG: helix-turn-helix domain-containing protein [Spirochaetales bacterium]|nr:helix-turn-helix domain-containing protein [Spirochaetales bacterium]